MDDDDVPGARRRPLNPNLLLTLALLPEGEPWMPVIYGEGFTTKWSEADVAAFEALGTRGQREAVRRYLAGHRQVLPEPAPERRKNRLRQERLEARSVVPRIRYVRRHSLDPILDGRLSSGACRTLTYLIARCGKSLRLKTVTAWIAQALAVTTRTVQNHYKSLEASGYIVKSIPDKRGRTTLYLTAACEPPDVKKLSSVSKDLTDRSAKKTSHNQTMKGEEKRREGEGDGDDQTGQVSVTGSSPANPVAEPVERAPPPDCPTVESMPPEAFQNREKRLRTGDRPQGVSGGPDAKSAFDLMMDEITKRYDDAFAERREREAGGT